MHGFPALSFFTQQNRLHDQQALAPWLLSVVQHLSIRGATLNGALQGIGPAVQVTRGAAPEEAERLLTPLAREDAQIVHIKTAVKFGFTGRPTAAADRGPTQESS